MKKRAAVDLTAVSKLCLVRKKEETELTQLKIATGGCRAEYLQVF